MSESLNMESEAGSYESEGGMHEGAIESNEDFSSKIEIRFFRHDEKGSSAGKTDQEVTLTEKGRIHAAETAEDENVDQSVAFGSPRLRAKETALLHMAGQMFTEDELKEGEYALDKIIERVGPGKVAGDERLDFNLGQNQTYVDEAMSSFKNGAFLKFLVERSDDLAKEVEDETAGSYSRVAGNIAKIVKKYLTIAPRFDELVKEKPEMYKKVMKRFMGSHQTTPECFLAKVIEKTKGVGERDKFVQVLNNTGFDFSEGYECDVTTDSEGKVTLRIKFSMPDSEGKKGFTFEEDVDSSVIDEIISDIK